MNMLRFTSHFLIAFASAISATQAQTPQQYTTITSIAALKAITNRPQVVQVTGTNAGIFNLNAGACVAADDLTQVQPTTGTTVCYVRAMSPYAVGVTNAVTVGTTTIDSGTTNGLLYNNAGVLGNLATMNNGVLITNSSGVPVVSSTLTLEPTNSGMRGTTHAINTSQWATGIVTGPTNLNTFKVWADDIDATNSAGIDYFVQPWSFESYFGGNNMRGGRNALAAYAYLTSPSNSGNDNRNYVGLTGVATAQSGDGGTGTTFGNSKGAIFGSGFVGVLDPAATNIHNVTGSEINVAARAGSTVYAKSIAQFSNRSDDAVKGSGVDAMLWLYKQGGGAPTMDNGILFDYPADANSFPFDTNSTVLKVGSGTVGYGIDLLATTVTGAAFRSNGFSVSGTGAITAGGASLLGGGDTSFEVKTTGGVGADWLWQSLAIDGRLRLFDLSGGAGEVASFTKGTGTFVLNKPLAYGGVTLNNAVTGTGNMVLSAAPTLTGAVTISGTIVGTGTPTSCSGQPTGTFWNDAGTVKVCP